MKNRFLILLSFVLIVARDVVCANTSMVRERININRDWRYQIDDPNGTGAALHYSQLKCQRFYYIRKEVSEAGRQSGRKYSLCKI